MPSAGTETQMTRRARLPDDAAFFAADPPVEDPFRSRAGEIDFILIPGKDDVRVLE